MANYLSATYLSKDDLAQVEFENIFQKSTQIELNSLLRRLFQAMIIGNNNKSTVKLFFNTKEGYRYTESTIWSKTNNSIMLKGGKHIPIGSICNVEFP